MMVVSDTSPVLNLAAIGRSDLLEGLFTDLLVPAEVADEIHRLRESRVRFRSVILPSFIQIRELRTDHLKTALSGELDAGEAAAIAMAIECEARLLLVDELRGRAVARRFGIPTLGVLGILRLAKQRGLLAATAPVLSALEEQAGFWIGAPLRERFLREDETG